MGMKDTVKHGFARQLWISFGIIGMAVAAAATGVYFLSKDLAAQADQIIRDKTLIARETAVLGILAKLKSDAPVAAQYAAAMSKLLPVHDDLIGFPAWLAAAAKANNVSAAFSFRGDAAPATPVSPGADGFTMSVSGPAVNVLAFLDYLEARVPAYLLAVDSFDFGAADSGYRVTLQGKLFSRSQ